MVGAALGLLICLIPLISGITVAVFFIYKKIFDRHTTKVLQEGVTNKRKWIAPWALALIVLGVQLVLATGTMYLMSMYMVNTQAQTVTVSEEGEPMPVILYTNTTREFVHKGDGFQLVDQGANDGLSCKVYKKINEDNTVSYCFSGKLNKWHEGNKLEMTCLDEKGDMIAGSFFSSVDEKDKNCYYELRVNDGAYRPGSFVIRLTQIVYDTSDPNGGTYELKLKF